MATPTPAGADASQRVTMARILGTIIAAMVVWRSLEGLFDRLPESPPAAWNAVPVVLAAVALAGVWRRPPAFGRAVVALIAAVLGQLFVTFGDSTFARAMGGGILALVALYVAWMYLVLPLFAWRRGRWPVDGVPLVPFAADPAWPAALQRRLQALAAPGFVPRLMHVRAEQGASATIVLLVHPTRDALARVTHFTFGKRALASTALSPWRSPGDLRLSVTDTQPVEIFPSPSQRVLLFPDAAASQLLDHLGAIREADVRAGPPADAELVATWDDHAASYQRWLVDHGYLARDARRGERAYTLKGGFASVWSSLWPWHARQRSRQIRAAQAALRGASRSGAA